MNYQNFVVRGTSDGADYYRSFNYNNLKDISSFTRELKSSSGIEQTGLHFHQGGLAIPFSEHRFEVYRINESNLVLEITDFPIPKLAIDGEDRNHIKRTLDILRKKFPKIKIERAKESN